MIRLLGLFILLSQAAWALVPVEGIILGEAQTDLQTDPLLKIFREVYDKGQESENNKIKFYYHTYETGQQLNESCSTLGAPKYSSVWEEKQVHRTMAATLQYIGIDTTVKAIGAYAKKLEVTPDQFKVLTQNLVKNYCSKNITVISLKTIEKSLQHYYDNPLPDVVPSIESSPFAPETIKASTEKQDARSKEFDLVLRNFRSFCSWGGEPEDYRLLSSYLNNRYIMAFVIRNMLGFKPHINKNLEISYVPSNATVRASCSDLICRTTDLKTFKKQFPLSIGSTGLHTDLLKNYCHHFRFQDLPQKTNPVVKDWIRKMEIEDPVFETSQFISLMTGVPDLFNSVEIYNEIPLLVRSSIDERWSKWAMDVLSSFSHDLYYEESFKVRVEPRRDLAALQTEGFMIDFTVTLGEMDRLMKDNDKLSLSFDLKLTKNFIREIRTKWSALANDVDTEGQKKFKEDIARYLNIQLKEKEKLFTQKLWNDEFSKLIAEELIGQALTYRGSLFNSYQDELLRVPVKFSYGLFAISYLRYRSDVAAGRIKLNL